MSIIIISLCHMESRLLLYMFRFIPEDQTNHDMIIQYAAKLLNQAGKFEVYTNPDGQHNTRIGNSYPDIILTHKNSLTVSFIIEVETSNSVIQSEVSHLSSAL